MFPRSLLLQVMWTNRRRWLRSPSVDRVDPSPRHLHQGMCSNKNHKWALDGRHVARRESINLHQRSRFIINEDLLGDTWTLWKRPIFIDTWGWKCTLNHAISSVMIRSDGWNDSWKSSTRSRLDRTAIVVWSHHDRGSIKPWLWLIWKDCGTDHVTIGGPWCRAIVATNQHPIADQTARDFWKKIPFKNDVFSSFLLNFWLIHEAIKRIWSKNLSSSWFPRA